MKSSFWQTIEIPIKGNYLINDIKNVDDTIIIAGSINDNNGYINLEKSKAYIEISKDRGKSWFEFKKFSCNVIIELFYKDGIVLMKGLRYISGNSLIEFYRYNVSNGTLQEIKLPGSKEAHSLQIINNHTYIFNVTNNQFGNSYLKTEDGGITWSDHLILLDSTHYVFDEKCINQSIMWGIKTQLPNDHSITSINTLTWKHGEDILLKKQDDPVTIKTFDQQIYLLVQCGSVGYLKILNELKNNFTTVDSFYLNNKELANDFYISKDYLIVNTIGTQNSLPNMRVLYKKNEKEWNDAPMPELAISNTNFNNNLLMGVAMHNIIYYRQF